MIAKQNKQKFVNLANNKIFYGHDQASYVTYQNRKD